MKQGDVMLSKARGGIPTKIRLQHTDEEDPWLWIIEYLEFEGKIIKGSTIGMSESFIKENFQKKYN